MPPKRPTHYHCGGCEQLLDASQFTEAQKVGRYDQRRRCIACLVMMRTLLETGEMPVPLSQRQPAEAAAAPPAASVTASSAPPPASSMPLPPWLAALGISEAQMTPTSWLPIAQFFVSNDEQQQQQFKLITDFISLDEGVAMKMPSDQRTAAVEALASERILQPLGALLLEQIKRSDAGDLGVVANLEALLLIMSYWVAVVELLPPDDKRLGSIHGGGDKRNKNKSLWDLPLDVCTEIMNNCKANINKAFTGLAAQRWFTIFMAFVVHNGNALTQQQLELPIVIARCAQRCATHFAAVHVFCNLFLCLNGDAQMLIALCDLVTNYASAVARVNPADNDLEMVDLVDLLVAAVQAFHSANDGVFPSELVTSLLRCMGAALGACPTNRQAESLGGCLLKHFAKDGCVPFDSATDGSLFAMFLLSVTCTSVSPKRITDLRLVFSSPRARTVGLLPIFQHLLIETLIHAADFFDHHVQPPDTLMIQHFLDVYLSVMRKFIAAPKCSVYLQLNSVRLMKRLCVRLTTSHQSLLLLHGFLEMHRNSICKEAMDELQSGAASTILLATAPLVTNQKATCVFGAAPFATSSCNLWVEFAARFSLVAYPPFLPEDLTTDRMSTAWTTVLERCSAWSPSMACCMPLVSGEIVFAAGCFKVTGKLAPSFLTKSLIKALLVCSWIDLRELRREWGDRPRKSRSQLLSQFQGKTDSSGTICRVHSMCTALYDFAMAHPSAVNSAELRAVVQLMTEMVSDVDKELVALVSSLEGKGRSQPA